jgi:hypothetical protein
MKVTERQPTDPVARVAVEADVRLELCPFCGHPLETRQHVKYHWQSTMFGATCHTIALSHMECDACGSYITTPDQSRRNKRSILATKAAFPTVLMA